MENGRIKIKRSLKIGLPRSLIFFLDIVDWEIFFTILGCKVIISDISNYSIFRKGFAYATNDQCFPVKVFLGHIAELKSKVDLIFVPQIVSLRKNTFSCPKIIGLPFLSKKVVDYNSLLFSVIIDVNKKVLTIYRIFILALKISWTPFRVFKAMKFFIKEFYFGKNAVLDVEDKVLKDNSIGLLGHKYALNDTFLNMKIVEKIKKQGMRVVTSDDIYGKIKVDSKEIYYGRRPVHWDFAQDLICSADYLSKNARIKGIIFLTYFGCGIDAFVEEMIKKIIDDRVPYLCLSLDEHSGEAGLLTRIEAFVDMIRPRNMVGIK